MEELAKNKKELRGKLSSARLECDPQEHAKFSAQACEHLLQSYVWQHSKLIALYVALKGELNTDPLLHNILEDDSKSKKLLLPLCGKDKGELLLAPCTGYAELSKGAFGILEPKQIDLTQEFVPDLMILPLLAFDKRGTRLGYGGGYYDRLCQRKSFADALRIGLAFEFQEVEALPKEAWDIPLHGVCTEQGLRFFA